MRKHINYTNLHEVRYAIRIHKAVNGLSWDDTLYCGSSGLVRLLLEDSLAEPEGRLWHHAQSIEVHDRKRDQKRNREEWLAQKS